MWQGGPRRWTGRPLGSAKIARYLIDPDVVYLARISTYSRWALRIHVFAMYWQRISTYSRWTTGIHVFYVYCKRIRMYSGLPLRIHVSFDVLQCIARYLDRLSQYMYLWMYYVVFILGTNGERNTCIVEMYSIVSYWVFYSILEYI